MITCRHGVTKRKLLLARATALAVMAAISLCLQSAQGDPRSSQDQTAPVENWRTSPWHGMMNGYGQLIPCRCRYQGQEYTEAPVGLIVDALLREVYSGAPPLGAPPARGDVPENLTRFFSGKAAKAAPASSCCAPQEHTTCCAPTAKAACCGPSPSTGSTGTASCGCK